MRPLASDDSKEAIRQLFGAVLACVVFFTLFLLPNLLTLGALLLLGAGAAYAVIAREKLIRVFLSSALVLLLPLVAIVSTLWSAAPNETLRASIQYTATVAIMIILFRTLPLRLLIAMLMLAGAAAALRVLSLQPDALLGHYALDGGLGSKNIVAFNSSTTIFAALGVMFDRVQPKVFRMAAVPTLLLALLTLVLAQSAGAFVSTAIGVFVLGVLVIFKRFPPAMRGGAFILILAIIPLAWFVGPTMAEAIFADMLAATGKDATLTGRTELWNFALSRIPDHPIAGLGYQAFWIQGSPDAEAMWRMGQITVRSGFTFHNQYLELMMELGGIGLVAFLIIAISGFIGILYKALIYSNPAVNCVAVLLLTLLTRSTVESVLTAPFSTFTALFMAACCVGITPLVQGRRAAPAAPAAPAQASRPLRRASPFGRPT